MSRKGILTPTQRIEVIAWHKFKVSLGSCKTKAAELGVSESAIKHTIAAYQHRERREMDRRIRVALEIKRLEARRQS